MPWDDGMEEVGRLASHHAFATQGLVSHAWDGRCGAPTPDGIHERQSQNKAKTQMKRKWMQHHVPSSINTKLR